ncbi:50S ribosomal protein L21 [bacterium]|nr:50S ribosomal protein L21 [bacterium]|tara:strand:+ start:139 stop:453 length:315 start_codon:yes stop_codon:yes gene_type:complete
MSHAVIKSGSKQYLVSDKTKIKVEKLPVAEGKTVKFKEVLLTEEKGSVTVGTPLVAGAVVEGTVTKQGRHPKVTGVKMKAKKRNRKLYGHKQAFTEVEITKIGK